jgi:hypothetical protein
MEQVPTEGASPSSTRGVILAVLVVASVACWVGFYLWLIPDFVALFVTLATLATFILWRRRV